MVPIWYWMSRFGPITLVQSECVRLGPQHVLYNMAQIWYWVSPIWSDLVITDFTVTPLLVHARTAIGQRSFAINGPRTWNSLPADLRTPDTTLCSFKRQGSPVSAVVYAAADWWLSTVRPAPL